jgi:hypothetical protein
MSAASVPLSAHTGVAALAWDAVSRVAATATALWGVPAAPIDPVRVGVAYTSERWLRVGGSRPSAFAPLSGFFATADGWVRTHGNYPHHALALTTALELPPTSGTEEVARAFRSHRAAEVSSSVRRLGGLCIPVRGEDAVADANLRATPLVSIIRLGRAPRTRRPEAPLDNPLRGVRVLDLTRVIAGPVATRTLALFGADVLRIDPPRPPELPWQHLDTGHGKRTALLDLTTPGGQREWTALLSSADIVVLGYRAAGLDRLGLTPAGLAAQRPGLIVLQLTAWGDRHHRGFDSLVQAASGIAWLESRDETTPGALPAQALDHTAGYALADAALMLLARRAEEGGSWLAETSLRRVAAELLGLPRRSTPSMGPQPDPAGHVQEFDVDGVAVSTAAPAFTTPARFSPPRPWGRDPAAWPQ